MCESCTLLSNMDVGQCAQVKELLSSGSMRKRLQDLGLICGTNVECLQKSPCGDPVAFLIRGAVIALRCEDSSAVVIDLN